MTEPYRQVGLSVRKNSTINWGAAGKRSEGGYIGSARGAGTLIAIG